MFTSSREKRLWVITGVLVLTILMTLGISPLILTEIINRGLANWFFTIGLTLVAVAIATHGLRFRPGGAEIAASVGIIAVYLIVFTRLTMVEERSHLIEYSVVAILIFEALKERAKTKEIRYPGLIAFFATFGIGLIDEFAQILIPGRVFDPDDILFNFLAAFMAVTGSFILTWTRNLVIKKRSGKD